jgi:molecular chaperone GrpE (heat shock protein)
VRALAEDIRQLTHSIKIEIPEGLRAEGWEPFLPQISDMRENLAELSRARQKDLQEMQGLREDNQRLRQDYYRTTLRPALTAVLGVFDTASDLATTQKSEGARTLLPLLEQALGQGFDAWAFRPQQGDPIDMELHRTTGAVTSQTEAQPNTVATLLQVGFRATDGHIHRKANIEVYR